jgi:hypothetical protein
MVNGVGRQRVPLPVTGRRGLPDGRSTNTVTLLVEQSHPTIMPA